MSVKIDSPKHSEEEEEDSDDDDEDDGGPEGTPVKRPVSVPLTRSAPVEAAIPPRSPSIEDAKPPSPSPVGNVVPASTMPDRRDVGIQHDGAPDDDLIRTREAWLSSELFAARVASKAKVAFDRELATLDAEVTKMIQEVEALRDDVLEDRRLNVAFRSASVDHINGLREGFERLKNGGNYRVA